VPSAGVEEYVSRAAEEHPSVRRALVASRSRSSRPRRRARRRCRRSTRSASVGNGRGLFQPGVFGQNTEHRPAAQHAALRRRRDPEPDQGDAVLEERARNDLEAARRGVTQTTRQAYYTLQSGAAQVKALEAAEASSQLALEATQVGYRVGIRVNVDVLNAQSQLYQTRRDLARARYDVLLATLGCVRRRVSSRQRRALDRQPAARARRAGRVAPRHKS
jgi:outer membrane protein